MSAERAMIAKTGGEYACLQPLIWCYPLAESLCNLCELEYSQPRTAVVGMLRVLCHFDTSYKHSAVRKLCQCTIPELECTVITKGARYTWAEVPTPDEKLPKIVAIQTAYGR